MCGTVNAARPTKMMFIRAVSMSGDEGMMAR
jgi:hypothetical protein